MLPEIWKNVKCSISKSTYYCPIGCFSEVSLDYLYKLHNLHNDYSIKPEETIEESKFSLGKKEKLIPILDNKKKKYKPNYKNLMLYQELELELKQICGVFEFKQTAFLKPYIKRNAELWMQAEKEVSKKINKKPNEYIWCKNLKR